LFIFRHTTVVYVAKQVKLAILIIISVVTGWLNIIVS